MKVKFNWDDDNVHATLHDDNGTLIDRITVLKGWEIEWTIGESADEIRFEVAVDIALPTESLT